MNLHISFVNIIKRIDFVIVATYKTFKSLEEVIEKFYLWKSNLAIDI